MPGNINPNLKEKTFEEVRQSFSFRNPRSDAIGLENVENSPPLKKSRFSKTADTKNTPNKKTTTKNSPTKKSPTKNYATKKSTIKNFPFFS